MPCLPVWELTEGIPSDGPHGLGLHKRGRMNDGSMSKAEICQQGIFWILKHPDTAGKKPASKWPAALGSRSRRGSRAGGCQGQLPFAPGLGTVPLVYGKLGGGIWLPNSPCRKERNTTSQVPGYGCRCPSGHPPLHVLDSRLPSPVKVTVAGFSTAWSWAA